MPILVTGAAGYIGGQTMLALLDRHETPIVLDLSNGTRTAIPRPYRSSWDVGDTELVTHLIRKHMQMLFCTSRPR